ncbi:MAG: hypothetical protein R8G66_25420 [Cytophagales bacterium]|nr:hypothetical protein [Cytophagales bacterium]
MTSKSILKPLYIIPSLLCLLMVSALSAQAPVEIPDHIPPSPTSAELGKYGNVPVNLHNGSPNISIPLYEIVMDDISVPISLSFHASGHKVRSQASWVGLGWSLNAGGVVNRSMRGEPDEDGYFASMADIKDFNDRGLLPYLWKWVHENPLYPENVKANLRVYRSELAYLYDQLVKYDTYYSDDSFLDELQSDYDQLRNEYDDYLDTIYSMYGINDEYREVKNWMHAVKNAGYDTQADIFNYNYPGGSGTFLFKPDQSIAQIPYQDNAITPIGFTTNAACLSCNSGTLEGFEIINMDGVKYNFQDKELTRVLYPQDAPAPDPNVYESSWYLSDINSQRSGKSVSFSYSNRMPVMADDILNETITETINNGAIESITPSFSPTNIRNDIIHLESITWEGGSIEFGESHGRFDRKHGEGVILDSLVIKNKNGDVLKYFVFEYNNGLSDINAASSNYFDNHLLLTSVTEYNSSNQAKPPYLINYYHPEDIPARNSNAMDHDGFYNAAPNTSLVPSYVNYGGLVTPGADREPGLLTSRTGMVESITYPTGGKTAFEYENHDIWEGVVYQTQTQTYFIENCDANNILQPGLGVLGFECIATKTINVNVPSGAQNSQISVVSTTAATATSINNSNDYYTRIYDASDNLMLSHSSYSPLNNAGLLQEGNNYRLEINSTIDYTKMQVTVQYEAPSLIEANSNVGGLRIAGIKDYTKDDNGAFQLANSRTFEYKINDANRNKSSGILLTKKDPEYTSQRTKYEGWQTGVMEYRTHSSSGSGSFEPFGGSQVAYEEVREIQTGNGYTEYHYSNERDESDVNLMELPFIDRQYISSYPKSLSLTSSGWKRGQLIDQIVVDEQGNEKQWVHNDYTYVKVDSTVSFAYETIHEETQPQSVFTWALETQYSGWAKLYNSTTTTYENNQESVVSVSTVYDSDIKFILPKESNHYIDGVNDYTQKFEYLNDRTNHIISPVTEIIKLDDQDNLVQKDTYSYTNGRVEFIDKYLNGSSSPNYTTRLSEYNGKKPSYIEDPSGINAVYLWGYGGTLPVAKITNIDYTTVENTLGSNLQAIENSYDNNFIKSQLISLKSTLSQQQPINIFLHKQGVGMVEAIDTNGVITTYHYDAFNRLYQVKDQDQHVLKEFHYNYSN